MLDPATGTGTFLVEWVHQAEQSFKAVYPKGDWPAHLSDVVLPGMHAFELMLAPYAIAHLRIALVAKEYCVPAPNSMILLTDSLEYPSEQPHIAEFGDPVAEEGERAARLKRDARFSIVIGNPPYRRARDRGGDFGGWVRHSSADGKLPLMDSFVEPLRAVGRGSAANTLHELSVYFWRWALWKVLEQKDGPGVISFITPRAFLSSPGHAGMRQVLRERFDEMWLLDLGGDNRGAVANESNNVFAIETGVCITVGARYGRSNPSKQARAHYALVDGTRTEKLASLETQPHIASRDWVECPTDWQSPLIGANEELYHQWPDVRDLFPWQISGSQFKRLWPIGESTEVLEERWQTLLSLGSDDRRTAYRETRDRLAAGRSQPGGRNSKRFTGIELLPVGSPCPTPVPYSFRTLDRQWVLYDDRLGDFIRETLYAIRSDKQVFFSTLMSKRLGDGPAITATDLIPDLDFFCNRGAADIIPMYRDPGGSEPNVTPGLCQLLSSAYGIDVDPEDIYAYVAAIMFGPSYVERFNESLRTPGPRIPISKSAELFREGVKLGRRFVWLQTYGQRWTPSGEKRGRLPRFGFEVESEIPAEVDSYPETYSYDASTQILRVGSGRIAGVSPEVWGYEQSKWRVVERWLAYRMKTRAGRAGDASSSALDSIRPQNWTFTDELLDLLRVVQGCVEMWPAQDELLQSICEADTFTNSELPTPRTEDRSKPQVGPLEQSVLYE
jgi:hypothetical protein